MIRVKKGNCRLIGNKTTVLSECTLAVTACADILARDGNVSVEEAIDIIYQITKESYKEVKEHEKI